MSLESNIAALVAASTELTQAVNITKATVEATRDSTIAKEAPVTTAKDAVLASTTAATTDAATTGTKLAAAAADYATQKTTKGLAAVQTSAESELKDRLHRRDPARHPFRGARPSLVMDFVRRECHRNNAAGNLEPVDLNTFMTFTRGSTATYVGPDGLIKTAGVNEARYGYDPVTGEALGLLVEEQRTNLTSVPEGPVFYAWDTKSVLISRSNLISPSGMLDVIKVYEKPETATEFFLRTSAGTLTAQTLCMSVYVHSSSERTLRLRAVHTSCALPTSEVSFVMATKTFGSTSGYITSSGYVDAGNGWYRVWMVFTIPSTSSVSWGVNLIGGTTTGDGVSGLHLWGFQLEAGAFPTSYIPTPATFTGRASTKTYFDSNGVMQTAASGVAATDYGYVDGRWVSKGLSLEPQATNLALQSGNLVSSSWGKINTTCTVSAMLAPDNVSYAAKIVESLDTVNTAHYISQNPSGLAYSTQYTGSIFLKAAERSKVRIVMFDGVSSFYSNIDLITGTISFTSSGASARVTPCGNGWYRCEVTATTGSTGSPNIGIFPCDASYAPSYIGDGVSGIYAWGAQYAAGPVATSYIPTTTAQVTRAADTSTSAQVTRANESVALSTMANWYNRDSSTFCVSAQRHITTVSNSRILTGTDSSFQEILGIRPGNEVESYDGTGLVCAPTGWDNRTPLRAASTLGRTSRKLSSNGANVVSGAASSKLVDLTAIKIWPYTTAQTRAGYIKQLTYFPRQLSDADLQALTILED